VIIFKIKNNIYMNKIKNIGIGVLFPFTGGAEEDVIKGIILSHFISDMETFRFQLRSSRNTIALNSTNSIVNAIISTPI
jgi:hypothetical protein